MIYQIGEIEIDTTQFIVRDKWVELSVEPKVFDLIIYLIVHRERPISRDELFEAVWAGREVSDATLSNHINSARKVFGDNGERQAVIKTIRGRGYQFVAEVEEISENPSNKRKTNHQKLSRWHVRLYQSVILLLLILTLGFAFQLFIKQPALGLEVKRVAVLPLLNLGQSMPSNLSPNKDLNITKTNEYLGFAVADQIVSDLSKNSALIVRGSSSVRQFASAPTDLVSVANELDVEYLVLGNFLKEGSSIQLNIELIEVKTNQMLWRDRIDDQFENVISLQHTIAENVSAALNAQFSIQDSNRAKPKSLLAYDYYLRAIAHSETNEGAEQAIKLLEKTIALDPEYYPAFIALGDRVGFLSIFKLSKGHTTKKAISYYEKALQINPNAEGAISGLAARYAETGEIERAFELTKHLIQINPNNASAHFSLGYIYRYAGLLEQSIRSIKQAIALDHQSRWSHNLGVSYFFNGEFNKAIEALNYGEQTPYALGWKASVYMQQGKNQEALKLLNQVIDLEPGSFWELDSVGFKSVIEKQYAKGIAAAQTLEEANINDGEAVFYWGALYAMLNDKAGCYRMLKQGIDKGYYNYPLLKNDFFFSNVAESEEYQSILKSVKKKHQNFKKKFL